MTVAAPTPTLPKPTVASAPAGAARMQSWYVDARGRHHDVPKPVPVTADNRRTAHRAAACGKGDCTHTDWMIPGKGKRYCPVHGNPLTVGADGRGDRRRALAAEARMLHGASALPWLVLIGLAAAGLAVALAPVQPWQVLVAAPVAYGAGYGAGLAVLWRQAVRLGRVQPGQRAGRKVARVRSAARRIGWHGAFAVAWIALAAEVGPPATITGRLVWALLAVGWALRAYPWWAQVDARRSRGTPKPVAALPAGPPPLDPVLQEAISTWSTLIGQQGGPLAGTVLTDVRMLPAVAAGGPGRPRRPNFTGTVRSVVAGAIDMRASRPGLLGRICAAYFVVGGDVSFAADPNDQSIAYLRVCPDNPLAQVRMYAGPDPGDWRRGWSVVGRFDDDSELIYAWWTETGAVHDLISGCTGSGKSELVLQLILRSLHSQGLVMDWLGDPQGGQSFGAVKGHVAWFAPSKDEIRLMLIAALKEMDRRTATLSAANVKTWRASRDMPLLVITLDEVQRYIDDAPIAELITTLVGQGRKAGIKLRLITQVPASYALGGTIYIKEQLMSGQTFTFRAETELAGRHASEGDDLIDPRGLPKRWGKWTCGEGKTTAGLLFVRGVYGKDLFARADYTGEDMTMWLYDAAGNLTTCPGEFSADAVDVAGVLWYGRWDRARLAGRARSDSALLNTADAAALIQAAELLAAAGYDPAKLTTPGNASGAPATARDMVHAAAARAASDPDGPGVATRAAVAALLPDMPGGTRDGALADLVAAGALERQKQGRYRVVKPAPNVALPEPAAAVEPDDDADLPDTPSEPEESE